MQSLEHSKDFFPVLRSDSDTVVLRPHADHSVAGLGPKPDARGCSGGDELQSICEKIENHFAEKSAISLHVRQGAVDTDFRLAPL